MTRRGCIVVVYIYAACWLLVCRLPGTCWLPAGTFFAFAAHFCARRSCARSTLLKTRKTTYFLLSFYICVNIEEALSAY